MTTFSAGLTSLLPQSHDCRCYVSRRILACPLLWLQEHTDLRAHYFAHCSYLWHQLGSLTVPSPEAGDLVELIVLYTFLHWTEGTEDYTIHISHHRWSYFMPLSDIVTSLSARYCFKSDPFAVPIRLRSLGAANCVGQIKHWDGNINPRLKV